MFIYLWEYVVAPADLEAFSKVYGPKGAWVDLFSRSSAYLGTTLVRDQSDPDRFVTIDRWESEKAHADFVATHHREYEALDAECEKLTQGEALIGRFVEEGRAV